MVRFGRYFEGEVVQGPLLEEIMVVPSRAGIPMASGGGMKQESTFLYVCETGFPYVALVVLEHTS